MSHRQHGGRHDFNGYDGSSVIAYGWWWLSVILHRTAPGWRLEVKVWGMAFGVRWNPPSDRPCLCDSRPFVNQVKE